MNGFELAGRIISGLLLITGGAVWGIVICAGWIEVYKHRKDTP